MAAVGGAGSDATAVRMIVVLLVVGEAVGGAGSDVRLGSIGQAGSGNGACASVSARKSGWCSMCTMCHGWKAVGWPAVNSSESGARAAKSNVPGTATSVPRRADRRWLATTRSAQGPEVSRVK